MAQAVGRREFLHLVGAGLAMGAVACTTPGRARAVDRAFTDYLADPRVLGAALYLARDGEVLVDRWGGWFDAARTRPWRRDTRTLVASTGKMASALCVLHLVDQGRLGLDQPVADVWPEFAQAGKGAITVRQVLTMRAGLVILEPPCYDCFGDYAAMVRAIEQQAPNFEPGSRCMYQTSTFWFLCGEIVRRVSGEPIGRYWRRVIAGDSARELTLDVLDDELPRLSPTVVPDDDPFNELLNDESGPMGQAWRVLKPRGGRVDQAAAWNAPSTRRNGVSGFGNARGLAAMAGLIVNRGTLGPRRVFSAAMMESITAPQFEGFEHLLRIEARLGLASFLDGGAFRWVDNPRAFFMMGGGGHIALGDPDRKMTLGFCVNRQEARPFDQIPPVAAALEVIRSYPRG